MTDGDLYEAVDSYSSQHKIAYIHFRNVRGKVPHYWETFIDEGDIDMLRVLRILRKPGSAGRSASCSSESLASDDIPALGRICDGL